MDKKIKVIPLEIKALGDTTNGEFEGYGSIFGNKDAYGDIVMPGAFAKSLVESKPQDIKLLWQHDSAQPIGIYKEIKEDSKGLYVKGQLCIDDVPKAREAYGLLKMGAISGLSIGYMINPGGSKYDPTDNSLKLTSLKLMEISVVTFPANQMANVQAVKEFDEETLENVRKLENFLRDVGGYSLKEAKTIASRCFKAPLRDAESETTNTDDAELAKALSASILQITKLKGI